MSRIQFRNCANKRRFHSKAEALSAIADKRLGVYSCPVCSGFHLTSQTVISKADRASISDFPKPTFDSSLLARAKWIRK